MSHLQSTGLAAPLLGRADASRLTIREHIATLALQGILASPQGYQDASFEGAARDAVAHADALLEELAK